MRRCTFVCSLPHPGSLKSMQVGVLPAFLSEVHALAFWLTWARSCRCCLIATLCSCCIHDIPVFLVIESPGFSFERARIFWSLVESSTSSFSILFVRYCLHFFLRHRQLMIAAAAMHVHIQFDLISGLQPRACRGSSRQTCFTVNTTMPTGLGFFFLLRGK